MSKEITIEQNWNEIEKRMRAEGLSDIAIKTFHSYYLQLVEGSSGLISGSEIDPPTGVVDFETLEGYAEAGKQALDNVVMINLNGGLGTSMGLNKAKSLLPVKDGLSFLDIIVKQVLHLRKEYNVSLPLVFMNSFRTEADSLEKIAKYENFEEGQDGIALSFIQNKVPKLRQDNFAPVAWPKDPALEWCPPGHGDIYTALVQTDMLDNLLARDYRYAFVSNADNLGAVLDLELLGYFASAKIPFLMEVTDRTQADKKGGHVARAKEGHLLLRESAQCPPDEVEDFQNVKKYTYFNTNSLWLDLQALKAKLVESNNILDLPMVRNAKTVDPKDDTSPKVFQLETVMGTAISLFEDSAVMRVPRSRFAPVKTTNDLLDLWSDDFLLDERACVVKNPKSTFGTTYIDLDSRYYKKISDFEARFPHGAPSLANCSELVIKGDVRFGKDVSLNGVVHITNDKNEQLVIEDGRVFSG